MNTELDDQLVAEVDDLAGSRGRSSFVRKAVESAVREEQRWAKLRPAAGALSDATHDWDADPGEWVRGQRRADARRAG